MQHLGADAQLTADADAISAAPTRSCFPASGTSARACVRCASRGLEPAAKEAATDGRPFLGICVGMQMLFEGSDESPDVAGLGVVAGPRHPAPGHGAAPADGLEHARDPGRQPARRRARPDPPWCYFVHTFAPDPADDAVVAAWCEYGRRFAAAIEQGPLWATQFHPEKSGAVGPALLANFVDGGRRHDAWISIPRSICATGASCSCSRATTNARRVYDDDPVAVAQRFAKAGARWIHVVDLDAAAIRSATTNRAVIDDDLRQRSRAACRAAVGCVTSTHAGALLEAGVERVVVGSAAIEHPELVDELAERFPRRVAVGLDARGRDVATHGWSTATGVDLRRACAALRPPGRRRVGRDRDQPRRHARRPGPRAARRTCSARSAVPVIASGGVASMDDLAALAALDVGGRRLEGAIAGTAIYEGRFTIEEGIAACSQSG